MAVEIFAAFQLNHKGQSEQRSVHGLRHPRAAPPP